MHERTGCRDLRSSIHFSDSIALPLRVGKNVYARAHALKSDRAGRARPRMKKPLNCPLSKLTSIIIKQDDDDASARQIEARLSLRVRV